MQQPSIAQWRVPAGSTCFRALPPCMASSPRSGPGHGSSISSLRPPPPAAVIRRNVTGCGAAAAAAAGRSCVGVDYSITSRQHAAAAYAVQSRCSEVTGRGTSRGAPKSLRLATTTSGNRAENAAEYAAEIASLRRRAPKTDNTRARDHLARSRSSRSSVESTHLRGTVRDTIESGE